MGLYSSHFNFLVTAFVDHFLQLQQQFFKKYSPSGNHIIGNPGWPQPFHLLTFGKTRLKWPVGLLPQGIKLQNKNPCQLPTHQLQAGEGGRREFSWQRPQVASRQTTWGISSEDGPELASPTPNTRTLGIAGGGLVAFWRQPRLWISARWFSP